MWAQGLLCNDEKSKHFCYTQSAGDAQLSSAIPTFGLQWRVASVLNLAKPGLWGWSPNVCLEKLMSP